MKNIAYIYGHFCISLVVFLAVYFITLFAAAPFSEHLTGLLSTLVVYSLYAIPICLASTYFLWNIIWLRKNEIPPNFRGWRYLCVCFSFAILLLGAFFTFIPMLLATPGSAMSGVPLGIGIVFSCLFVLPAMAFKR